MTRRERSECVPSQAETPLRLSAATTDWGGEPGFCFDTNDETESGQTPPKTGKGLWPAGESALNLKIEFGREL